MNPIRFDDLARALSRPTSRRVAVGGLVGAALAVCADDPAGMATRRHRHGTHHHHGGNRACAHFCAAVFGAGTPAAGQCAREAAHGQGLCPSCHASTATLCCPPGGCTTYAAATCCQSGETCGGSGTPGVCGQCAAELCGGDNGSCCPGLVCCNGICRCGTCDTYCGSGEVCRDGVCSCPAHGGETCGGNGVCCAAGTGPAGGCCTYPDKCCPSELGIEGYCCYVLNRCCHGTCCPDPFSCCSKGCCNLTPLPQNCCPVDAGPVCCPQDAPVCCPATVVPAGCCPDDAPVCCPPDANHATGFCCTTGSTCCAAGCCPTGQAATATPGVPMHTTSGKRRRH